MVSRIKLYKAPISLLSLGMLLFILVLTECAGSTSNQSTSSTQATSGITPTVPIAAAPVQALMQEMILVGQPAAKMLKGLDRLSIS